MLTRIITLLAIVFSLSANAQSKSELSNRSTEELEQMKQDAIDAQNFDLAQSIKEELTSRKSVEELIADKEAKIKSAASEDNYRLAAELKEEVQYLKEIKSQLAELQLQLDAAVQKEDYAEANRIKEEIKALKSGTEGPGEATANARIIIEPLNAIKGFFMDILVDGSHLAQVDKDEGVVFFTEPGQTEITFALNGSVKEKNSHTLSLDVKGNYTYLIEIPERLKHYKLEFKPVVDEQPGTESKLTTAYVAVEKDTSRSTEWDTGEYPFNYAGLGTDLRRLLTGVPAGAEGVIRYNVVLKADYTLSDQHGLYAGASLSFGGMKYEIGEDIEVDMGFLTFSPNVSYYFLNGKVFTPYAGIETPISFTRVDEEYSTGAGVNFRTGTSFFVGRGIGFFTEFKVGITGGWILETGISFRGIPKRNSDKKNAYYYNY